MIKKLEAFFLSLSEEATAPEFSDEALHLASAALLVEVATIDQDFSELEKKQLQDLLVKECHLSPEESLELIDEAETASADSASLYEFTQKINQHFSEAKKIRLIENLWKIAYADDYLDKHEEHIIRRIADLIHVRHQHFIQAKIKIRDA